MDLLYHSSLQTSEDKRLNSSSRGTMIVNTEVYTPEAVVALNAIYIGYG